MRRRRVVLATVLAAWSAGTAFAGTRVGDVEVTPIESPYGDVNHGYVEYRFQVRNFGARSHGVTLEGPDKPETQRWMGLQSVSRHADVGPASTAVISILQPNFGVLGDGLTITLDSGERGTMPFSFASPLYGRGGGPHQRVLLSHGVSLDDAKRFLEPAPPVGPGWFAGPTSASYVVPPHTPQFAFVRPELPVGGWPTGWLGYSSYDGVVVTGDELAQAPGPLSTAIFRYVEAGGTLLVLGALEPPAGWTERPDPRGLRSVHGGFGQCLVGPAKLSGLLFNQAQAFRDACARTQSALLRQGSQANELFPVVEKVGTPVRSLFVVMLLFAVAIGPMNLYVLSRLKRKILIFLTIPAISVGTAVVVTVYSFLSEGWQRHVRTECLTLLDETAHRATTIGWTAFYSTLTPGDGLLFSNDTELTYVASQGTDIYGSSRALTLDWSAGQHLRKGWLQARIPTHFQVRKSEARRERVPISRNPDGGFAATNGLGVDISELWFADATGAVFHATGVEAGSRAVLRRDSTRRARGSPGAARTLFATAWVGLPDRLAKAPESTLAPGEYLAVVKRTPFLEDGLANLSQRHGSSIVLGRAAEGPDAR